MYTFCAGRIYHIRGHSHHGQIHRVWMYSHNNWKYSCLLLIFHDDATSYLFLFLSDAIDLNFTEQCLGLRRVLPHAILGGI